MNKIKASLSNVVMPREARKRVWRQIEDSVDKEAARKRGRALKWALGGTAAAVIAAAAIVLFALPPKPGGTPMAAAETPAPAETAADMQEGPAAEEQPAGGDDSEKKLSYFTNLAVSDELMATAFPDEITVYEERPIVITEEEMRTIEENALAHGWLGADIYGMEGLEGLYFMGPGEEGEWIQDMAQHEAVVMQFMDDSGLDMILKQHGMTLTAPESKPVPAHKNEEIEAKIGNVETLVWSVVDGHRSSGYVRISIDADHHVLDCKIWAVNSVPIDTVQAVPLEQAVNAAFVVCMHEGCGDDDAAYIVDEIELVYNFGIPMYELHLTDESGANRGYVNALAVSESVIEQNEASAAAYEYYLDMQGP